VTYLLKYLFIFVHSEVLGGLFPDIAGAATGIAGI
jgi:hypothetical protein